MGNVYANTLLILCFPWGHAPTRDSQPNREATYIDPKQDSSLGSSIGSTNDRRRPCVPILAGVFLKCIH